jgi:hypothetical protein
VAGGERVTKCKGCIYAQADLAASTKGWTAFECGNPESPYSHSLLNVTPHGNKQREVAWSGCIYGVSKVGGDSHTNREAKTVH